MGGDDLGSEDEFLVEDVGSDPSDSSSEESDTEEDAQQEGATTNPKSDLKLSKRAPSPNSLENVESSSKKRKRGGDDQLRDLGSDIRDSPAELQAKLIAKFAGVAFLPSHIAISTEENAPGMMKRIQGIISKKKLKQWKNKESPCVLVVCISARRAVQVLKELAPFNVRVAKLFAKHITIEEQVKQLNDSSFGLAVGTPHRILTLAQQGALSMSQTQCVVLDTYQNDKRFSVYTLPDTVPHSQALLKDYVFPYCQKQKGPRLAFL